MSIKFEDFDAARMLNGSDPSGFAQDLENEFIQFRFEASKDTRSMTRVSISLKQAGYVHSSNFDSRRTYTFQCGAVVSMVMENTVNGIIVGRYRRED